jgi:hypothetical protein
MPVKNWLRVGTIVLIGMLCSGCAMPGYDSSAAQKHLVAAGVAPATARCVVERMTAKFGANQLSGRVDPTALELRVERTVLSKCGVKNVSKG